MCFTTRIGEGGRIVLPARLRREAGLAVGDPVVVRLADGEVRLIKYADAVQRAQALVRPYLGDRDLVEELIAERRAEAERE